MRIAFTTSKMASALVVIIGNGVGNFETESCLEMCETLDSAALVLVTWFAIRFIFACSWSFELRVFSK